MLVGLNIGSNGSFLFFSLDKNEILFIALVHGTLDLMQVAANTEFLHICCSNDFDWDDFDYAVDYIFELRD